MPNHLMSLCLPLSLTLLASCTTASKPEVLVRNVTVPVPAELIDCPGIVGTVPDKDASAEAMARFIANNIPTLAECGADAEAQRRSQAR